MGLVATAELEWRTELADAQGQQDVAARSVERHDDAAHRATPPLLDERQLLEVHRWIRYEALRTYDIAVIAGDGIGPEVVAAGKRVLDGAAHGFSLRWHDPDQVRRVVRFGLSARPHVRGRGSPKRCFGNYPRER